MELIKLLLLIFFAFGIIGCKNYNRAFVEKYGNDSFDKFRNKAVVLRGFDFEHEDVGIFFVNQDTYSKNGPYITFVNIKTGEAINGSCRLLKDSSNLNKLELNALVVEFIKYRVYLLVLLI